MQGLFLTYVKDLYNVQMKTDDNILHNIHTRTSQPADLPDLGGKSERAVCNLQGGKFSDVDNVSGEIFYQGGMKH